MKTILFIVFLLSGYLCLAAPSQGKGQTVKVVNIDSVYQKQMVEMSSRIEVMEGKLDSIGAVNRDLLFSRELYSDLISTQLYWFGIFSTVVTVIFGLFNFGYVVPKLKEYKKEQDEYKASTSQIIERQSTILEEKFNLLITDQKTEFSQELEKQTVKLKIANVNAYRGMYFEANRRKMYDTTLCWATNVLKEMIEVYGNKEISLKSWIKRIEELNDLITASFSEHNYEQINEALNDILNSIGEEHKERIKSFQENINIKYYSLLDKAKKEKPKD